MSPELCESVPRYSCESLPRYSLSPPAPGEQELPTQAHTYPSPRCDVDSHPRPMAARLSDSAKAARNSAARAAAKLGASAAAAPQKAAAALGATAKRASGSAARTYHRLLREELRAANPLNSRLWFAVKHPLARFSVSVLVAILNLYVYYGDPATYSNAESYGTMIGDIYHGWFEPDDPAFLALRLGVMCVLSVVGVWGGLSLQRYLRDTWRLVLFGHDNGENERREPLASQDGAVFLIFTVTCLCYFFGLKMYNGALAAAGAERHKAGSGMHRWTYAYFNLILAGLFTFVCDAWAIVTVGDQMLQEIDQKRGVGYDAYAREGGALPRFAAWFARYRLRITRASLALLWGVGCSSMISDYVRVDRILSRDGPAVPGERVGRSSFWSPAANDEFARMFVGCVVAFLNILIVMQDWDFPDFSGGEIKISGFDVEGIRFERGGRFARALLPTVYISGKWFNYMGVLMGLAFDWGYWFMTALPFRPCDYAQFWDSETGAIYALVRPKKVQEKHAGDAAAKDCPWFTDHPLLALADVAWGAVNRSAYDDDAWGRDSRTPRVVRVETGTFTGAYTVDENDRYVYFGNGAFWMWAMCLIPISAWIVFWWLVFTHEQVHCLNYREVSAFLDKHRDRVADERCDDDADGKRHARRRYFARVSAAAHAPRCKCRCLRQTEAPVRPARDPEDPPDTWAPPHR